MRFLWSVRAHARAEFARLAYLRAVAAARAEPTPARWDRLLRASANLRSAMAERERERLAGGWRGRSLRPERPPERPPGRPPGAVLELGRAAPPRPAARAWPALDAELARARTLRAQARRLVARSRALCDELRHLSSSWMAVGPPA